MDKADEAKEKNAKEVHILENDASQLVFECPHCDMLILVAVGHVNCKIFRHGILKQSGRQVNPHLSQVECERMVQNDQVYGCCKPFQLVNCCNLKSGWKAQVCGYI